jgi:hypothetical protein
MQTGLRESEVVMRRVLFLSLIVLSCLLALPASGLTGKAPGFTGPTALPGSDSGSEPSLAISTTGIRYASWQAPGEFASSPDGVHFTNLGSPDPGALGDVSNAVDAAGALYNSQICGLPAALHTCVYRSLDGGHTWPQQTIAADVHPGASDRPWIDVYPKNTGGFWNPDLTTVYLEYHTFSPDDLAYVTVSHDGGKTFSPPRLITTDTNAISGSGCNTIPSGVAVDAASGAVYALWLSGNDVASNVVTGCNYSQIGPFDKAWVSVSTDGGLTWTSHLAWQGAFDQSTKIGDNADKIFGTISVDRAGQVHVLLPVRTNDDPVGFVASCETGSTCQEQPQPTNLQLVTSPDGGAHWTAPFKVNASPGSYFFPWIAAGSSGIVDAIYYRTSSLQPNDPADQWYAAFSQITGATATLGSGGASYTTTPQVASQALDPNPAHVGGICTFGVFCSVVPNANRSLADSIAIALDPAGGANPVWTNDAGSTRLIDFACQSSGPSAFAGAKALHGCYAAGR